MSERTQSAYKHGLLPHDEMTAPEAICLKVLERITPGREERERVFSLAEGIMTRLRALLAREGLWGEVRLEGSLAKDTWLSGEADVDIFVRFKPDVPRKFFRTRFLELAKEAARGFEQIERFAEHPYLECYANGIRINIVPCYAVEPGAWLSATDRTPYHTEYVKAHLNERLKGEVRLLKKFMKGIGAYGAELRTGGFSGYLCELLVIYYGGFLETLRAASRWRKKTVIDPAGHYRGHEREAVELFMHHLIVVDPVDPGRNAAASVRLEKMALFILAAREFLRRPSELFFFPEGPRHMGVADLRTKIRSRGTSLLAIRIEFDGIAPDILWGQLWRTLRALSNMLKNEGFKILRTTAWSDEISNCVLLFELETASLPIVEKHIGPPIWLEEHVERFLKRNLSEPSRICGPFIEADRLCVLKKRKWPNALELLRERLKSGGKEIGVAPLLAEHIARGFNLLSGEEVAKLCDELEGFKPFLIDFLEGRPCWLVDRGR